MSTEIKNLHKALKELGHEMPLGHVYEAVAKAAGHKSWNVAKTKDLSTANIFRVSAPEPMKINGATGEGEYEAKLVCSAGDESMGEIEMKRYIRYDADSPDQALEIACEIAGYYMNEIDPEDIRFEQSRALIERLGDNLMLGSWEIITNSGDINIESIIDSDYTDILD